MKYLNQVEFKSFSHFLQIILMVLNVTFFFYHHGVKDSILNCSNGITIE